MEYLGIQGQGDGGVQPPELMKLQRRIPAIGEIVSKSVTEIKGIPYAGESDGSTIENQSVTRLRWELPA